MPDSLSAGICLSKADRSPMAIGSFESEFAAENAAAEEVRCERTSVAGFGNAPEAPPAPET